LFKRSYDARKKSSELCFIYTIDLSVRDEAPLLLKFADDRNVNPAPDVSYKVVGQAPAGSERTPDCGRFRSLRHFCRAVAGSDGLQADHS
jgi:uncharacterized protein